MILSMKSQIFIFAYIIGIGFLTGILYDLFRIIRKVIKHSNFFIHIEDIIYWILVTFIVFRFIISKNNGETRLFLIAGVMVGMILYFYTLSFIFVNSIMSVLHIIEKIIKTVIAIILFPIKLLIKIILVPLRIIKNFIIKLLSIIKKATSIGRIKTKKSIQNIKILFKKT